MGEYIQTLLCTTSDSNSNQYNKGHSITRLSDYIHTRHIMNPRSMTTGETCLGIFSLCTAARIIVFIQLTYSCVEIFLNTALLLEKPVSLSDLDMVCAISFVIGDCFGCLAAAIFIYGNFRPCHATLDGSISYNYLMSWIVLTLIHPVSFIFSLLVHVFYSDMIGVATYTCRRGIPFIVCLYFLYLMNALAREQRFSRRLASSRSSTRLRSTDGRRTYSYQSIVDTYASIE